MQLDLLLVSHPLVANLLDVPTARPIVYLSVPTLKFVPFGSWQWVNRGLWVMGLD